MVAKYRPLCPSGDYIGKVLPVPIPNTAVKLSEPMIVHTSVKVGIAGFLKTLQFTGGFFFALHLMVDPSGRSCLLLWGHACSRCDLHPNSDPYHDDGLTGGQAFLLMGRGDGGKRLLSLSSARSLLFLLCDRERGLSMRAGFRCFGAALFLNWTLLLYRNGCPGVFFSVLKFRWVGLYR